MNNTTVFSIREAVLIGEGVTLVEKAEPLSKDLLRTFDTTILAAILFLVRYYTFFANQLVQAISFLYKKISAEIEPGEIRQFALVLHEMIKIFEWGVKRQDCLVAFDDAAGLFMRKAPMRWAGQSREVAFVLLMVVMRNDSFATTREIDAIIQRLQTLGLIY